MGIVKRQAFGNSVVQYVGILIGFLNVAILFPRWFDADQFGLTRIMIALAVLYSQFAALGTHRSLVRFMPLFRSEDNKNNGLLLVGLLVPAVGYLIITALYILLRDPIVTYYQESSALFTDNYFLVIPFALCWLCTIILEFYLMGMFRTVFSNFMRHVFIRLLWLAAILLYHFKVVDWQRFLLLFVGAYAVNSLVLVIYLMSKGGLHFKLSARFKRKSLYRAMRSYGIYSMFSGVSNIFVNRIDIIMVGALMISPLENVAYYAIALYVASFIHVPAQAIARISFPLVADKWRSKDIAGIAELYRASALNQLILGGGLFVLVWANVDSVFLLIKPEYAVAKWALFFLGIAKLIDMATGVNGTIINATRFYRFDLFSALILIGVTVVSNYLLIMAYGLAGAALATALSLLLYNGMRIVYIYLKINVQPFEWRTIVVIALLVAVYFVQSFLPTIELHFIADTIVRSALITLALAIPIYSFRLSPDIRTAVDKLLRR